MENLQWMHLSTILLQATTFELSLALEATALALLAAARRAEGDAAASPDRLRLAAPLARAIIVEVGCRD